ncbi:NADH-quinone oxidoreductase subunit N [Ereboglobus sp. PH5-10]|uniref:NADH-quinone oxidoreductase subunit N n=1 Tax=Ereboglobus sp. PH5-10 TaxID=2940629 RepID=UPI0024058840|nr:NADH-quinone oxidoreductase subunit N [Ereboglobus sp. PH5-10]MDF9827743.1 NADH-quinone oxidoreductase subunit N [Ereboglobus sp. PH5-10]
MNATINYAELVYALRPEIALTLGLLLALGYDMAFGRRMSDCARRGVAVLIGIVTLASAVFQTLHTNVPPVGHAAYWFHGAFVYDTLAHGVRLGVFGLSALTLLLIAGSIPHSALRTPHFKHPAEYVAIQLLATMGFSLMAVSNNLLIAFLGFELASLSLYVMAGFDKTSRASAEASLKYFLFGGMAAAFMLFGFSLIYGMTGTIVLPEIARALAVQGPSPLLLVALVMVLVGFGYKAAAAPFHQWAPDVYQGAPAPAAALIASASKLAGFAFFARLLFSGLGTVSGDAINFGGPAGWIMAVIIISAASMLLGNIAALAQTNARRLIAYSAIAHAGIMLLGVIAVRAEGAGPLFYYALTYGIATIGVFGVFAAIERTAPCQRISDLAGLWKRSPFLALVLFVCVLSLAGIPPLAGFFGKFYLFAAALYLNGLMSPAGWLAFLAIAMSAVGLYYYLVILKAALVTNATAGTSASTEKIRVPLGTVIALATSAALTIALGIWPDVVLGLFK